jgi:large subunit ribosomal protein L28
VPHYWFPTLLRSIVYSEILDKHMAIIVTQRTLNLIHENYGLDHYILKVTILIMHVFLLPHKRDIELKLSILLPSTLNGRLSKEDTCLFQTPACDLQSLLAFKLKRKMLLSLLKKDMYPDDPVKREDVYNTYKKYLGTVSLVLNYNS